MLDWVKIYSIYLLRQTYLVYIIFKDRNLSNILLVFWAMPRLHTFILRLPWPLRVYCSNIYTVFSMHSPSLQGSFQFSYSRGHGVCNYPKSSISQCSDASKLVFRYQVCNFLLSLFSLYCWFEIDVGLLKLESSFHLSWNLFAFLKENYSNKKLNYGY